MLDDMRVNDIPLEPSDIRQLENAGEIAHLFARLRYDVDVRKEIPLDVTPYANTQDLKMQIHRHEWLATDPVDEDIRVYLFEVRSLTAKLRNDLARGFLNTSDEKVLLVLTPDYEEIEFVYLERSSQETRRKTGLRLKATIRPIPLTVNRRDPHPVALRVLKRFTFTEKDSDYQWEKLRSAYMLAEWSEQYFNNRALFSDYYLKQRLTDPKITPEWGEDVRPVARAIHDHIIRARKDYAGKSEREIRQGLYEPIFDLLGFTFDAQKSGASSTDNPDYLLYAPGSDQPIAAALTYVWNRNLDDVDVTRERAEENGGTPFEIPGAIVVSLMEREVAPWIIVTNGKLWRLYSSTASNKATNYYEVDLEEAVAVTDPTTAVKYWWLMFRRAAFTGFLDTVLQNSADYAKELGDRLKDRVFVEIFPQFAKGFIAQMRAQGVPETDIDLDEVFSGTMTFLYRLMFTLYAESLELVPINEIRGYREISLYRMKNEIADAGGILLDESPGKLQAAYKASSTDLYTRLTDLFTVIDQGSDDLNLPTYNGGLFSRETASGRFLAAYAIPDRYLALGLDRLTRDIDEKTQALVFIDFKSLGVRQLGSIYEGLLEFKLKIAAEKLAVTKSKGKEVYQPAKKVKKPLATIAKGDVYLENDKRERKATGSYYTPDYIVKYIVRHTVGPVLDRKFEELTPRLRDAQHAYRDAKKRAEYKGEDPEKFWNRDDMQQLVNDCLNVRVLDPAMGSGHFLVEVVDYTSNRLIDFLNAWSENPVWAFIDQTRQDILDDMQRQQVSIDPDRLTRVALLKRAVLKRCVYGVDLNEMAVELAKVSLWLDAFTLGAPLSFLDHHLKHGNSLIGARVAEVQKALEGQQTLFSQNKFAGVMLATDLMRQVSYLSDNTIEQTRRSAQAYRDARDHLAPYKRVLDVYTSRWFGNAPRKGKRGGSDFDYTIEFLKRDDTQAWLEDPHKPENHLPADDYMQAGLVAKRALQAAADKHFFHWELEFPEVFFAPSKPGGQDVQLKEDGGFDAVVGNPPYDEVSEFYSGNTEDENTYFTYASPYEDTKSGRINLYRLFLLKFEHTLAQNGMGSFIIPLTILSDSFSYGTRKRLLKHLHLDTVEAFPQKDDPNKRVFPEAKQSTCILLLSNTAIEGARTRVTTHPGRYFLADSSSYEANQLKLYSFTPDQHAIPLVSQTQWHILEQHLHPDNGDILKQHANIYAGELCDNRANAKYISDDSVGPLILRGGNVQRYELIDDPKQGKSRYLVRNLWLNERGQSTRGQHHKGYRIAFQKGAAVDNWRRLIATVILPNEFCFDTIGYIPFGECDNPYALLALFNSSLWEFRFSATSTTNHINAYELDIFHVPNLSQQTTPLDLRERQTAQIVAAYEMGDHADVLRRVQAALDAGQTDVVHDVLAHLAQRMIDLNQDKQAEVKRFLGWLEDQLDILPKDGKTGLDVFTGKKIIRNYLGDYQKGEGELPFPAAGNRDSLEYRLYQNRNRYRANLDDVRGVIEAAYEASLATLLPIKRDLARTDALIDKIVYRLYGLTDDEIELIERPQYEQALADAKAQAVADEKIGDEEKIEKIAKGILPAAKRFFERVEPRDVEAALDAELPGWRSLPSDAPTFLVTGDYNLRALPDHMDFSASVIPYAKAVEVVLYQRIFEPFRQQHTADDVENPFLKDFMLGKRHLTLGNYGYIVPSSKEIALQAFMTRALRDAGAVIAAFKDSAQLAIRNKAAHDEVLSRDEARQARAWAIGVLGVV